jgi:hypothetical protein
MYNPLQGKLIVKKTGNREAGHSCPPPKRQARMPVLLFKMIRYFFIAPKLLG